MEQRTDIASFGEFALIEHLTQEAEIKNASTVLSIGDDAAVIDHFGKQTVVSTDLLVEGIQFHPESILSEHGHALLKNFLQSK